MTKKYNRKNGYFKHYNSKGISCRIKFADKITNSKILVKFKYKDDLEWMYHSPDRKFVDESDVINYLCKNLENRNRVFKIYKSL